MIWSSIYWIIYQCTFRGKKLLRAALLLLYRALIISLSILEVRWCFSRPRRWFWDTQSCNQLQQILQKQAPRELIFGNHQTPSSKIQEQSSLTAKSRLIFLTSLLVRRKCTRTWKPSLTFQLTQVATCTTTLNFPPEPTALSSPTSCTIIWHVNLLGRRFSELDSHMDSLRLRASVTFRSRTRRWI